MTTFADAQAATLAVLRARAGGEATYGTIAHEEFPEGDVPALPYAMVRAAAPPTIRYPVAATAPVRVVVWDESEAAAYARAYRLMAVLLDYPGDSTVRGFGALTGPLPAADPDTGRPICSFTVAARLRPITS